MTYKYISPITGLELETLDYPPFDCFSLTKNTVTINALFNNPALIYYYGMAAMDNLLKSPCLIWRGELSSISPSNNIQELNLELDNYKFANLNSLWFIKDNSVNAPVSYLQPDDNSFVHLITKAMSFSNSEGEHSPVKFSKEELDLINKTIPRIVELFLADKDNKDAIYEEKDFITNGANRIASNKNRLIRAFSFLNIARTTSELTLKISFYMALLECLFTSNSNEVKHQLSERVSLFIGGDKEIKKQNFDAIREAYDIRSSLMHGSLIRKTDNDIIRISKGVDSLTRQIFNKIIDGESEIFQLSSSDGDKKKFENYFRDLIF